MTNHAFGGNWTEDKLLRLKKYLPAYMNVLKQKGLKTIYVDAFAGTGYRSPSQQEIEDGLVLNGMSEELQGSAAIALTLSTPFDRYVFIEQNSVRFAELAKLRDRFPQHAQGMEFHNEEANAAIQAFCRETNWSRQRAVVFLDPYGAQVEWETLRKIAETHAIDLWLLFPLGMAVNRMLPRDGQIDAGWSNRLDKLFGEHSWFDEFYKEEKQLNLFGSPPKMEKIANFDSIAEYFVKRLETIFPHVAKKPRFLYNSIDQPLFMLCFAASNHGKGGAIALKIASYILER